jgi:hypothetical protein
MVAEREGWSLENWVGGAGGWRGSSTPGTGNPVIVRDQLMCSGLRPAVRDARFLFAAGTVRSAMVQFSYGSSAATSLEAIGDG